MIKGDWNMCHAVEEMHGYPCYISVCGSNWNERSKWSWVVAGCTFIQRVRTVLEHFKFAAVWRENDLETEVNAVYNEQGWKRCRW